MSATVRAVAAVFLLLCLAASPAGAQRSGVNVSGDFAFYVLSLSWSPSYCEAGGSGADRMQCGGRPYGFIVHGLWPQYEHGWPEFCHARPERAPEQVVRGMLDLMPSPGLVRHQWEKHGSCSGLSPQGYFDLVRRARQQVRIPPAMERIERHSMVSPRAVETAFRAANPGLPGDAMAVTCDRRRLREVRICMTRQLRFRPCPEIDRRACRLGEAVMPPVR